MKRILVTILLLALASPCLAQTLRLKDNTTGKVYGPVDYRNGSEIKIVDRVFTVLIRESPRQSLSAVLLATVIPTVDFRSANAVDVINFMTMTSKQYGPVKNGKVAGVNFIAKLTPAQRKALPLITLQAKELSMMELLKTVTELAGLSYKIEPNWVMIQPAKPKTKK